MKVLKQGYIIIIGVLLGCDSSLIKGEYDDAGQYSSRLQAQTTVIKKIVQSHISLPVGRYYKVKYSVPNAPPTMQRENAIWYNKTESRLAFEGDISSGPMCTWEGVSLALLEQASKSPESLALIDSLAKPNQPLGQCRSFSMD
ncbi:hypothetical protein GCM10027341_27320 [Spirosoma knui]